jgi:HAD superfamily hydrolase (TIGR01509 family)
MDGVLIDSEELHAQAKRKAFGDAGIALTDADLHAYIGRSDAVMIEEVGKRHQLSDEQRGKIFRNKIRIYEQEENKLKVVPGAVTFVRWAARNYRIALATSATKRNRVAALKLLGIADAFEVVVDLSDVSEPKPSPELYLTAVARLSLDPMACMVIEDALTGVLSAKRAGCRISALSGTFSADALFESGADYVFDGFTDLQQFLEGDRGGVLPDDAEC